MKPTFKVRLIAVYVLMCSTLVALHLVAQPAGEPTLVWRTGTGGSQYYGNRIATDADGNLYSSANTPDQLVLQKYDGDGNVLYSVHYGGSASDRAADIKVDAAGNLYVVGSTNSPNFVATAGSANPANGYYHAFVMKLNPAGGVVYVHGIGDAPAVNVYGRAVAVDAAGNAYLAYTREDHSPTRSGRTQATVTLAVIDPTGTTLQPIRTLAGNDATYPRGLAVDASGRLFVAGQTSATDFPVTPDALDSTADLPPVGAPGRHSNGFFSIVDPDGSLVYSTYIGGTTANDDVYAMATDAAGDVLLAGEAGSVDFPLTPGAFSSGGQPGGDAFIMKWTAAGNLQYSARIGGSDQELFDGGAGLAVDASGAAYLAVMTYSFDAPTTPDAFDLTFNGMTDILISRLSADGSTLEWSSYVGTPYFESADDVVVDGARGFYLTGSSAGGDPIPSSSPDDESYLNPPPGSGDEEETPEPSPFLARFAWPVTVNTPAGGGVTIETPSGDASVTFSSVTVSGNTTIEPVDAAALNLTLPGGFGISSTSAAYEIRTTATVGSPIEVCLIATGLSASEFVTASILHGVGGAWQIETTRRDPATQRLCADVASLSPFAVGVRVDVTPPQISCAAADGAWHGSNVALSCTASDDGSGLASAADASFVLGTSVTAGTETANAATDSRVVCDNLGNCSTAGPIGGNRIDLRAPSIVITAPAATRYGLGAAVATAYTCADAGSGVASCTGSVTPGAPLDTSVVGTHSFAVAAADQVGNTAAATVGYTVGYEVKALYDEAKAFKAGSTIKFEFALVDASGRNVSSAAIPVSIVRVTRLSDGAAFDVSVPVPFAARSRSYGDTIKATGLEAGAYDVDLTAGNDPAPLRLRLLLK